MIRPFVSVIIPTLNRPECLAVVLQGLFHQTYKNFEIIVVNQGEFPLPLKSRLVQMSPRHLHWIDDDRQGLARARNIGIRCATGEIVIGLEDDLIICCRTFVQNHAEAYREPLVGGTTGNVIEAKHKNYRGRVGEIHPLLGVPMGQGYGTTRQYVQTIKGGNMSFRRKLLLDVGGFDERFGQPAIYEDTDISLKVRRLGYKLLFLPGAAVVHLSAPNGGERSDNDPRLFRFVAYRDRVLLFRNNYPLWQFPVFISANLLSALLPILRMEWRSVELALRGLREGLRLFWLSG